MKQGGADMQVEGLILVPFDELDRGCGSPLRVVPLEGSLQVPPVDILRPSEASVLDQSSVDLFVPVFVLVEFVSVFGIPRDIKKAFLLPKVLIVLGAYVILAHKTGRVPIAGEHISDVHVVVFEADVETRHGLSTFWEKRQELLGC